jgi:putative ABC transport system permease protein
MSLFRQIWAVTAMNIRGLPQRLGPSLVIVIGVGSVVAVMISLLAVGEGVMRTIGRNDQPDRVVVLSSGAAAEYMGSFTRAQIDMIGQAPGVKRDPQGKPLVQPYAMIVVEMTKKKDGGPANVIFRGSGDEGLLMQPKTFHLIAGRYYRPAVHELIVGKAAQANFNNLDVGDTITLRGVPWSVVGAYEDNGGIDENAIVADADTVLSAFDRTAYQSVGVQLESPDAFQRFKDSLKTNPQLNVEVKHLSKYYQDQVRSLAIVFNFVGYFVGAVMAIGTVFGALTTMYSAVDARAREIATLRAIGFGGTAVVISVLVEALMLSVPGALLGSLVAWVLFNGHAAGIGSVSFPLAVTPALVGIGVVWSIVIGLIGGFAPSIRAARLSVAAALRST